MLFRSDPAKFTKYYSEYASFSGAKVNPAKSQALLMNGPTITPPLEVKPTTSPICHLGAWLNHKGIDFQVTEAKLIQSILGKAESCNLSSTSIIGRASLINTYLFSKIWFKATITPLTKHFFNLLTKIIQKVLWNPTSPLLSIKAAMGKLEVGGWGLIDVQDACSRCFQKTLGTVQCITGIEEDNWTKATRIA